MIEHVPYGRIPLPPPSNKEREQNWRPLYDLFRARERDPVSEPRDTL